MLAQRKNDDDNIEESTDDTMKKAKLEDCESDQVTLAMDEVETVLYPETVAEMAASCESEKMPSEETVSVPNENVEMEISEASGALDIADAAQADVPWLPKDVAEDLIVLTDISTPTGGAAKDTTQMPSEDASLSENQKAADFSHEVLSKTVVPVMVESIQKVPTSFEQVGEPMRADVEEEKAVVQENSENVAHKDVGNRQMDDSALTEISACDDKMKAEDALEIKVTIANIPDQPEQRDVISDEPASVGVITGDIPAQTDMIVDIPARPDVTDDIPAQVSIPGQSDMSDEVSTQLQASADMSVQPDESDITVCISAQPDASDIIPGEPVSDDITGFPVQSSPERLEGSEVTVADTEGPVVMDVVSETSEQPAASDTVVNIPERFEVTDIVAENSSGSDSTVDIVKDALNNLLVCTKLCFVCALFQMSVFWRNATCCILAYCYCWSVCPGIAHIFKYRWGRFSFAILYILG